MHSVAVAMCLMLLVLHCSIARSNHSAVETIARNWMKEFERQLGHELDKVSDATWSAATNMTNKSSLNKLSAYASYSEFCREKQAEMRRLFPSLKFADANLTKLFKMADSIVTSAASSEMHELLDNLTTALSSKYSNAQVRHPLTGKMIPLEPNITNEIADLNQSEPVKRALWLGWHNVSGRQMRQNYTDFVSVSNAIILETGYKNITKYWQSFYETQSGQDFEKIIKDLWSTLKPLYQQLHAYVRQKLRRKYGALLFPQGGHIPAHLLGSMWAHIWTHIQNLTVPFPKVQKQNVSEAMEKQGWNATKLFLVAEDFFVSMGLDKMTDTFWQKSILERIPGVEMDCQPSAWNFFSRRGDFRIKQCTSINMVDLAVTHHEMGHVQYYQQYESQPIFYRGAPNPGFHEAIGDTLELAVRTPEHLATLGLLNGTAVSNDFYLNYLFEMALEKVAFLPFIYFINQWHWRVFDGTVGPERYNEFWWQLRCGLQGIASPVRRSAKDFDPGATFEILRFDDSIKYFVGNILQFQLYETLCNISGHTGPLYRCDFYGNKKAGSALKRMLSHGSSLPWEDVLEELTGSREISARPLLRYFADLAKFLAAENARTGERVGWDEACPTK